MERLVTCKSNRARTAPRVSVRVACKMMIAALRDILAMPYSTCYCAAVIRDIKVKKNLGEHASMTNQPVKEE